MRSSKNLAHNLVKAAPVAAAAPDIASLGLLEDDGAEETAIRPRPTEPLDDEPAAEFIDLEFSPVERTPEPARARELLGVPEDTARSRLRRARLLLEAEIQRREGL